MLVNSNLMPIMAESDLVVFVTVHSNPILGVSRTKPLTI